MGPDIFSLIRLICAARCSGPNGETWMDVQSLFLEAMACGKPVVSSEISGIPVVVRNGRTGSLVEEKNPEALAKAIIFLLKDSERREQFGKAGQQRIQHELTWTKTIEQFLLIYEKDATNEV